MARISLLDKTANENLELLCKLLDDLYAYEIIPEHLFEEIEEILFALHGPDDDSYANSEETSISSVYEICEDQITFIQDLRNTIRYVINNRNFNLTDAISEIIDLRDI